MAPEIGAIPYVELHDDPELDAVILDLVNTELNYELMELFKLRFNNEENQD